MPRDAVIQSLEREIMVLKSQSAMSGSSLMRTPNANLILLNKLKNEKDDLARHAQILEAKLSNAEQSAPAAGLPPPLPSAASGAALGELEGMPTTADRKEVLQTVADKKLLFDAHLHYFNYRQQSEGLEALSTAMAVVRTARARPPCLTASPGTSPFLEARRRCCACPPRNSFALVLTRGWRCACWGWAERRRLLRTDRLSIQEDMGGQTGVEPTSAPLVR